MEALGLDFNVFGGMGEDVSIALGLLVPAWLVWEFDTGLFWERTYFGFAFMKSAEEPVASFLTTDIDQIEKGPFSKGDKFTVSLTVKSLPMRVGDFYILGGLADKSGLLWYERKFSKLLHKFLAAK